MPENIDDTLSYYEKQIFNQEFGICPDCNQSRTDYSWRSWCQNCNSKRFQQNFDKWASGNDLIDKFIQDAQLKARNCREVIEWIPYNRFRNIQYLAQGGFSTVYKAIWLDGWIEEWDKKNKLWKRCPSVIPKNKYYAKQENIKSPLDQNERKGWRVVLKCLNNSSSVNNFFLNEWKNYLKFICSVQNNYSSSITDLYGITQDPETLNYMIVMKDMKLGNLRSNLMIKKYNPNDKYWNLYDIAKSLSNLHKCNLVHGDLHSGNLLLSTHICTSISDFGLSQPADKSTDESKKSKEIYGVLPYMAPEVLRGKPYTKAADVYSFGIIMWEMTSGVPAFNDFSHDFNLTLSICEGLRPKIVRGTEFEYVELMKKCWNTDPDKRPTAEELYIHFDQCVRNIPYHYSERILVPENERFTQNHPSSYYTTRKFDYSAKLNEILSQASLEDCIISS